MNYDRIWKSMNDVEEAFSQITTIEFLTNQIQQSVNSDDIDSINDAAHALTAFIATYQKNFDEKFMVAWRHVVAPSDLNENLDNVTELTYSDVCKYYNRSEVPNDDAKG